MEGMNKTMKNSTLCYIEKDNMYLMLHRIKKENDYNKDKWIGVGGKFEEGETAQECLLREVREETGLILTKYEYRGLVIFDSDQWELERMHLFTATKYEGDINVPVWGEKEKHFNRRECSNAVNCVSLGESENKSEMKDAFYVCDEGELMWVPKDRIEELNLWEGDKVFLKLLLEKKDFFKLVLKYEGEKLVETVLIN